MTENIKKLMLIDGMAMIYRGHFALIKNPRMSSSGLNTSSIFVFANIILDLIKRENPTHMAVCFDMQEPTHRHKLFKEYKAQRDKIPEDIIKAIPYSKKFCQAMNIPVITLPGWEADDIIGTLSLTAEKNDILTYMVTPDKDYAQLVTDKIFMYKPAYKGGGFDCLGKQEIIANWGINRVEQVIDILGLMGDASDNIPGVPGVGLKTAQKFIAEYSSIENLYDNLDQLKGKIKEKLSEFRDQAFLSKKLVIIDRAAPVKEKITDLQYKEYNPQLLQELFLELEFKTLGKRLFGDNFVSEVEANMEKDEGDSISTIEDTIHKYRLVSNENDRKDLLAKLLEQKAVCFDIETTGLDPKDCVPIGIAFSWKARQAFYVQIPETNTERNKILDQFKPFFMNASIEKIGHNLKFDISVLKWQGMDVRGPIFDTMIAAFLTYPHLKRNMDTLSEYFLKYRPVSISTLIGDKKEEQINMADVDIEKLTEYAGEDADITFQLSEVFRPIIEEQNQHNVFYNIDCPLISALTDMEYEGVAIDSSIMDELSEQLTEYIEVAQKNVFNMAGEEFNLSSPKQLGEILFEKLKLDPKAKRTQKSKQYSTNEQVLSRLAGKNEIVQHILDFRTFSKLKSTYVDSLPEFIFPKSRKIHTSYDQAISATGRIQSNNPNLQNIPIRSAMGKEVRKCFIARNTDHTLLSADYSQIELRIAAEFSQDPGLINAFKTDQDIHTATAMELFNLTEDKISKDMRAKAKTVNFGILYGMSAFGLSDRMNIPREEARFLIETYFQKYSGIKKYLNETIEFAHKNGFVQTLSGRRRYLRDINSQNQTTRKGAERVAINAPIQGTAADMIKIAMNKIHLEFKNNKLKTKLLLQVHDELVLDVFLKEKTAVMEIVKDCMVNAIPMSVPIIVEMGCADNWLEAH